MQVTLETLRNAKDRIRVPVKQGLVSYMGRLRSNGDAEPVGRCERVDELVRRPGAVGIDEDEVGLFGR